MKKDDFTTEEFIKMFPDLPNPEHHPIQFSHYLKLFLFYKDREKKQLLSIETESKVPPSFE
jgi:hypothetical protein